MMQIARSSYLLVVIYCCVKAIGLALRPFGQDPDLPSHLGAGLWMLDMGALPWRDPFGAQGNPWICYSWVPEIIMGLTFKAGAFQALRILALAFSLFAILTVILLVQACRETRNPSSAVTNVCEALAIAFALPLTFIGSTLRPQVIGFAFLGMLIWCAHRRRFPAWLLIPTTILWANSHVFWIFVPGVVFLGTVVFPAGLNDDASPHWRNRRNGLLQTVGYLSLGLINPFGIHMIVVMFEYLVHFGDAARITLELQPLDIRSFEFLPFAVAIVGTAACFRRVLQNESPVLIVLFIAFAVQSARQVRYLPFFALCAAPILARSVFPSFVARILRGTAESSSVRGQGAAVPTMTESVLISLLALGVGALAGRQIPLLDPHSNEIFQIAGELKGSPLFADRNAVNVFTEANDGGWFALAFWLQHRPGESENRFKMTMDTRGQVLGAQRFVEYDQIRQLTGNWIELFSRWNVDVVIGPPSATLLATLYTKKIPESDIVGEPSTLSQLGGWRGFSKTESMTVLARSRSMSETP